MHYIQVKLLNGFPRPLTYSVPDNYQDDLIGSIVKVPLKDRLVSAYVCAYQASHNHTFTIKPIHSLESFPTDISYKKFMYQLAAYHQVDPFHFIKRIKNFVSQTPQEESIIPTSSDMRDQIQVTLTAEQQTIVDKMGATIGTSQYAPALLHGVTGSGKTEIYKQLLLRTFNNNQSALFLLPEVSLALQFEQLLKKQLPTGIPIFGFHSATRPKEKKVLWQSLLSGKPVIIVGVHIPILLPIANLGLIIVDEEHEIGYQEKKHPKINTKEAALIRAQITQIPILLGSATPSIATLHTARTKNWQIFSLTERFAGRFPEIKIELLSKKEKRASFWITKALQHAITDRLAKKEQVIIFLNRRGYSFFVQCANCSFIFSCAACSVSLTLHNNNLLTCHYCSFSQSMAIACTSCSSSNLIKKGIGTQQIVTILESLFPTARIARADMDVSSKKNIWAQTMHDFAQGTIDILVGTQTITKGFHFPRVTLVGIIWADLNLNFPVYNAAETSLQQLIQVAGRAGRASNQSLVIVQSMMHHQIFNYLNENNYLSYYEYELANRQAVGYPPMVRLVEIELKHTEAAMLDQEAGQLVKLLLKQGKADITILGPAMPPVAKIKNMHARKIYIKDTSMAAIIAVYKSIDKSTFKSQIFFTPNPY